MYYASIVVAISGLILYQLSIKSSPRHVNPFWLLSAVYFLAAVACVPAGVLWKRWVAPQETLVAPADAGAVALIALAVVLIEVGYLLVYRSGWSLSVAPGLAQAVTLAVLFALGVTWFAEKLTISKCAGLLLALVGVFLLSRKG